jgi:class 3 adenylate cyclase
MSQIFTNLSLRSRLIIMLIGITLVTSVIVGLLGWQNGYSALNKSIFNQLNSIRSSQIYQVETYFDQTFSHTRTLANDRMIVNAMTQFQEGFNNGLYRSLNEEQEFAVSAFYDDVFVPEIAKNTTRAPLSVLYQPNRSVARYFQYHYIASNPYPIGEKDALIESAGDTTIYNRFHEFYQPIFRDLLNEFNYYDIFLIDVKSLSIVYSVFKEIDFATSLQDGPHRESALGVLSNQIRDNPQRDLVSIMDYRSYAPSYGAPATFLGAPIFDRNEAIGIIVVQLSSEQLNKVMTADGRWRDNGLGETGESYLVGSDKLMRSQSRLFMEDEESYFSAIKEFGLSATTANSIRTFNTTVLMQPVATTSVRRAFEEQSGAHISTNYYGEEVLSSYSPVKIPGLDWAIVSEMSADEAFRPIAVLQRNILIWGAILVLLVAFLAIALSRYFVRPIEKLIMAVSAFESGKTTVDLDVSTNDEFADLAVKFRAMTDKIKLQDSTIEHKQLENEKLLSNILPDPIVPRFKSGEQVAEHHQQATVMHLELDNFGQLSDTVEASKAAIKLQQIIDRLDEAAERHDVQPVNSAGTAYIAVCGLNSARLDHAKRTVEFSQASLKIVQEFNVVNNASLSVRIGVDSGTVTTAVIGSKRFKFGLWGATVDRARKVRNAAPDNTLLITQDVADRLGILLELSPYASIRLGTSDMQVYEIEADRLSLSPVDKEATV